MHRLSVERGDKLSKEQIAQDLMVSAFANEKQVVLVAINYGNEERVLRPEIAGLKVKNAEVYLTTGDKGVDMKHTKVKNLKKGLKIPARGMVTVVVANS
ncbi:hypothetical protein [Dyadobacter sp. 676]|uniref:Uncharacterized protein n=1 Tax=Dyadobacter sp. 676 TaxID=3088362 RepID=A0AAU8FQV6_9BACT